VALVARGGVQVAEICRDVLDALDEAQHAASRAAALGEALGRQGDGRCDGEGLPRPGWACRSVVEDGGVVHEVVSPLRPTVVTVDLNGRDLVPTEVSVSVVDERRDGRWIRAEPTVQIEAGSYSLAGARELWSILDRFLQDIDQEGGAPQGMPVAS
jgi:hypothetical protein